MYLKYLLLEDIKEKMLDELGNKNSKDKDIKNLEIGSVIYYNNLYDNMKLKIYDALIIQINYFEIFKNSTNSINSTEKLLKIGKKILKYKKEILQIWNKIIELNNFSDEIEQDFMLYLENIIQDNDLVVNKKKEYLNQKKMKFSEKNNLYYSLFNKDDSSIIIIDGFSMRGKIIYFLSNFALLFGYNNKEIINFYIYDLMSSNISKFHSALERDMLCYSNLDNIFKGERKIFIKGKNGLITCIFFIRVIPNFSYGLVYIMYVKKIKENFMVILDNEFIINSISDLNYTTSIELFNKNNFDLNNNMIGKHVGYILPEFLKLLTYKNEKFDISKILKQLIKTINDKKFQIYKEKALNELNEVLDDLLKEKEDSIDISEYTMKIKELYAIYEIYENYDEIMKYIKKRLMAICDIHEKSTDYSSDLDFLKQLIEDNEKQYIILGKRYNDVFVEMEELENILKELKNIDKYFSSFLVE
jgi:hypothetical protein